MSRVERHEDYVTRLATPENKAASGVRRARAPRVFENSLGGSGRGPGVSVGHRRGGSAGDDARRDDLLLGVLGGTIDPSGASGPGEFRVRSAMDASGHAVATGCATGLVRVWDARENRRARAGGHAGAVRCVSVDPTGRLCVSGSSDGRSSCGTSASGGAQTPRAHAGPRRGARDDETCTGASRRRRRARLPHRPRVAEERAAVRGGRGGGGGVTHQDRDGSEKVWTATMGADVRRWSAEAPEDEYHRKTKDDHRRARRDIGGNARERTL